MTKSIDPIVSGIAFLYCLLISTGCIPLSIENIEYQLNSTEWKPINRGNRIANFLTGCEFGYTINIGQVPFEIETKELGGKRFLVDGFKCKNFSWYFLSPIRYSHGIEIERPFDGIFISWKSSMWYLYAGMNYQIRDSINQKEFRWSNVVHLVKLKPNNFLEEEYKLTFLSDTATYYSKSYCYGFGEGEEHFFRLESKFLKKHPFQQNRRKLERSIVVENPTIVYLEDVEDCRYWRGIWILASDLRFYPDLYPKFSPIEPR